ncbi:hypothetical protein SAMN05444064_105260 [Pseudomonas syringae]|uniref:hypothetical protein n=1 Tax=Pseudomonas syringae TaxID=317 RepID=UPI00089514D8|nr:hypothetical protein [Pseudomonas syringae]SDW65382.1 hypothetical protein SAMN05444514_105250 [Pseudomonas syringae]SDW65641.1 hypothetical protein SAMN05444514_105260 [Pseudomonas syringae]SFL87955.1 hypothetical protein SAMN05444064_105250 [Pseudomonas syringae]SFL88191.1 hypothetical protein SAMN05444064_105260 [Pseudomonas syringae]
MQEQWKIVGKDAVELIQLSIEECRVTIRCGPATGFMTRSDEPPEAPITLPNRETAEALATILRNTTHEIFKTAKAVRA